MPNTETEVPVSEKNVDTTASAKKPASKSSSGSKKVGNRNALCHGVYSNELTLPWESPEDFEALHAKFIDEWKPSGCSEEQAVLELAHCTWIGWRAAKMAHLQFHRAPFGKQLLESGKPSWQDILQHEHELPKVVESTLLHVDNLLVHFKELLEKLRSIPYSTETSDGKMTQSELSGLGHRVSQTIEVFKDLVPTIEAQATIAALHWTMFDKAYQPDAIEQQMKVMAAVGARIDKILRRLMTLKEYKRIAASIAPPPRLIASPSVAPAGSGGEKN